MSGSELDVEGIPRDVKKTRCSLCGRGKHGAYLKCQNGGCSYTFHPLCAAREARAPKIFIASRAHKIGGTHPNPSQGPPAYCADHLPYGVDRDASGFWCDGYEMVRLRNTLDRGRTLADIMMRREKVRKFLAKAEGDLFAARVSALIAMCKAGAGAGAGTGAGASASAKALKAGLEEDPDLFLDSSDDEDYLAAGASGRPAKPEVFSRGDAQTLVTSDGNNSFISGTWTKPGTAGEVRSSPNPHITHYSITHMRYIIYSIFSIFTHSLTHHTHFSYHFSFPHR